MTERITSRSNPLIARIRKLNASRSFRREQGEFLCDGVKLLGEAVKWGAEITTLVVSGRAVEETKALQGAVRRVVEVPEDLMRSISPMESPQGALFLCKMPDTALPPKLEGGRYVVLDGLQDPGNVGTIWRTADAFGCDGLILVHGCADPFGPKTVRATMGGVFRLPVWEGEEAQLARCLEASGLPLYAAALREDAVPLGKADLSRCAVAIGSEGRGVSQTVLDMSEKTLKIPMEGRCESLNAAIAAAVVLWEGYQKR